MSATNIFCTNFSIFDIICENEDIKNWFIKIQLTLKKAILPLGQKNNLTTLESIHLMYPSDALHSESFID